MCDNSLCILKLSQQNFAILILAYCWLIFGEPTSSIVAIAALAYLDPLNKLGEERVAFLSQKLEIFISKIPGKSVVFLGLLLKTE